MSTYVREKVLRIPMDKVDFSFMSTAVKEKFPNEEIDYDFDFYLERTFPELFEYAAVGKFQMSPTYTPYLDYVLEYEWDADGEYGKTRALTDREKAKYLPVFQKVDPNINMDWVRLVEFCWYDCSEADDYYDHMNDPFYNEV
jgi:hypothetical protein